MKLYTIDKTSGKTIIISCSPDNNKNITITRGTDTRNVKIIDNYEFVFKCNKTSISARDGAAGLYKFLYECITGDFSACYADKIINYAMEKL